MVPNVLVIGDTILDRYVKGDVLRISPEAPVPVLQSKEKSKILGGACNVAVNIKNLAPEGCEVSYFGFVSSEIVQMLQQNEIASIGVAVSEEDLLTKTRYVCENYQLLRVDRNLKYAEHLVLVKDKLIRGHNLNRYDLIVISDYDKGTFTQELAEYIFENFDGPILIDLKRFRNWMNSINLKNSVIKCNEKEYEENRIHVLDYSPMRNMVITLGKKGYKILETGLQGPKVVEERGIFKLGLPAIDPVGAGDTFLAGMASNFLETGEFDIKKMAENGNKASAIRVSKFGKLVVTKREMEKC